MNEQEREIRLLGTADGRVPFNEWYVRLRDRKGCEEIASKVDQLQNPEFTNYKHVGAGVYELRIFFGPGYRVYFGLLGSSNTVVILIGGGDKGSQRRDIVKAKALWREFQDADNTVPRIRDVSGSKGS